MRGWIIIIIAVVLPLRSPYLLTASRKLSHPPLTHRNLNHPDDVNQFDHTDSNRLTRISN